MKKWFLITLILLSLLTACEPAYSSREAKQICFKCGWTGVEFVRATTKLSDNWEIYCTRTREGKSEVRRIEVVIEGCPAIMRETLEAMPDD